MPGPRSATWRAEMLALTPLVVLIVWIGVQPRFFLDRMGPTLDRLCAGVRATTKNVVGAAVVLPPLETAGKAGVAVQLPPQHGGLADVSSQVPQAN